MTDKTPTPPTHVMWNDAGIAKAEALFSEMKAAGTCERCQGNGEIVTDWERYRHPHEGDKGDEAVAECPDCNGEGSTDA